MYSKEFASSSLALPTKTELNGSPESAQKKSAGLHKILKKLDFLVIFGISKARFCFNSFL